MNDSTSRSLRMWLSFAALMATASSAFAAGNIINLGKSSVWTIYAFGNAQAVSDSLRALTNFTASGTFQSIVSMIAVIGVLGVGAAGGFNAGMAKRFIGYVVTVFLTCYVLIGAGNNGPLMVNVEVIDTVDMTWKSPITIPAIVGIPAALISTSGYRLTEAIEASFALPTALKMTNGAPFNLAAAMIADASQARITDPDLASSLAYYVQDCFTIGVAQGVLQANVLLQSTNFLNDIKFDHKGVMVNTLLSDPKGTPDVVTCSVAHGLIVDAVNKQGGMAADYLKDASAWTKTPAMSVLNAAADSTAQWASNGGVTDGAAIVKQSAVLSAFKGAYSQATAQTGNSEFLTGIAMAQATESQRTSWITGAEVFNKTMGYIFAIIQVFVYAIIPLVLCASLVPGLGLALLKNFSQILLWLAIWQPMLAIVNFIIISMQQAELGGILSGGGGFGFTLSNMGIISEKTGNLRAAASFVGTMVPALAWAMVKGSVDFSRVIGSAVGENFAQGAANTMTTGNYSLNSASMDSFTSNKHSTASTGAWGEGFSNNGSVGSKSNDLGGAGGARVGGKDIDVTSSANTGTQNGGNTGHGTTQGETGSRAVAGSESNVHGQSGNRGEASAHGSAAASGTGNQVSAGANAGLGVIRPGSGGTGTMAAAGQLPGVNAPGSPGNGEQAATPPGEFGKAAKPGRFKADLTAGVTLNANGQQTEQNTNGTSANKGTSGAKNLTGSVTETGSNTAGDTRTAGTTAGYSNGQNRTVTGVSAAERADVMATAMRQDNFMTRGAFARPELRKTELGDTSNHLATAGAIPADVKAAEVETKKEMADNEKATHTLMGNAEKAKDRNTARADHERNAATAEVVAGRGAAKESATTGVGKALGRVGSDLKADANDLLHKVGTKAGIPDELLPEARSKAAPANGPQAPANGPHAPAAPANGQASTAQGQTPAQRQQPEQPHAQQPHAQQPHAQQPHAQQPHAQQPHAQAQQARADAGNPHGHQPESRHAQQPGQQTTAQRQEQQLARAEAGNQHGHPPEQRHGQQPGQQTPAQRQEQQLARADAGNQHGRQPESRHAQQPGQQTPAQRQEQQLARAEAGNQHGHQPEQRNAQQPGQQTPAQRQEQQQLASHGGNKQDQGKPQDRDPQKQDDRPQLAQQDQQRQQEQRERELQERQLAAAAAVGQVLQNANIAQVPQMPQQQPGAPALPPQDGAPQLAAAPQPQPDANGAAPNPFSGEKAGASEGQLQGQVQVAEQKAERAGNQLRGVEGMLASADGRKPSELPDLINQARDMVRNA